MDRTHSELVDDLRPLRETPYYVTRFSRRRRTMLVERSAIPFPTLALLAEEVSSLLASFASFRGCGVILDMRAATPNNAKSFEAAMRDLRRQIGTLFPRVVVLVTSASGEMQVRRLHRTEGLSYQVTRSVEEAWQLAAEPTAS
ncbi:MAG: hypothetical protein ABW321_15880 [Polyangiales bacterium]